MTSATRRSTLGGALAASTLWLAAATAVAATPAEQYSALCTMCHLPGAHGAPQVGNRDDWVERIRPGLNTVYRNAIEGMPNTAMMAKGGHTELSDAEVRAIVDYMIAASELPADQLQNAKRYDRLGLRDRDFIRRDTSRDGFLSRSELAADPVLLAAFQRFDSNRDGRLSEAEYRKAESELEQARIAADVDDAALNAAVRKALAAVRGIDFDYVKFEVNGGALVMKGIVGHADVAIQAQDAVRRIAGIKSISNRLVSGDQMSWD
jgi:cytochrome c5